MTCRNEIFFGPSETQAGVHAVRSSEKDQTEDQSTKKASLGGHRSLGRGKNLKVKFGKKTTTNKFEEWQFLYV